MAGSHRQLVSPLVFGRKFDLELSGVRHLKHEERWHEFMQGRTSRDGLATPSRKTPLYVLLLGSFQKRVAMVVNYV